jgi:mannose-6-phosphate isomerase-like protein (cupin superfamily)
MHDRVNLAEKLTTFQAHWSPKIVGRLNDYKLEVVKVQGEFVWHKHDETDDFFLVIRGRLSIDLRDDGVQRTVELGPGELFVVPRGIEHRPRAVEETHILLIEPAGTPNTGDAGGPLTAVEEAI